VLSFLLQGVLVGRWAGRKGAEGWISPVTYESWDKQRKGEEEQILNRERKAIPW